MDSTFIPVTITFLTFIIIAYYLNVIRLSIPLVMIYFIYCFGYFINNDNAVSTDEKIIITTKGNNTEKNYFEKLNDIPSIDTLRFITKIDNNITDPKPIVSSSPSPQLIEISS